MAYTTVNTPSNTIMTHSPIVHIEAPAKWLKAGWRDFKAAPTVSLIYGVAFVAISYLLTWGLYHAQMIYMILPLSMGFMLFSPFLGLGLYEVSRQLAKGETPTIGSTWNAWQHSPRRLGMMGFCLLVVLLVWMRIATLMFALMLGEGAMTLEGVFDQLFFSEQGLVFLAFGSGVGLLFAVGVFMSTAVAIPMILDQKVEALSAVKFSIRAVIRNSHVMWSWGFTIAILTVLGMAGLFIGLIVIMPVVGYATWHAYCDLAGKTS